MTKTKRQLRAEAVERLRKHESSNVEWMILGDDCPNWVNYDTLSYHKVLCERIADLLADDETPDGDAVGIMRKAANGGFEGSIGSVVKNAKKLLGMDPYNGEDLEMMRRLAHMVERDYVRRDAVENHPEWIANLKCSEWMEKAHKLERERDEWKTKCETREVAYKQADAERKRDSEQIDGLTAERDELKAEVDAYRGKYDDMEFIVPIDEAMKFTTDPPGYVKKALADLQGKVDELTAERDYWRDQFKRCLCLAIKQDGGENLDKLLLYPTPKDCIEPFQLVTDEIESLRVFHAEACVERDRYKELYLDESWHSGYQRMELARLNAKLSGYPEPPVKLKGKDGKPIKRGQVLYGQDGRAWKIERFDGTYLWTENDEKRLRPEWLVHEQPDSWERILQNACAIDWPLNDGEMTELVERCEELAKEGEGGRMSVERIANFVPDAAHVPNMTLVDLDYPMCGKVVVRCGGTDYTLDEVRAALRMLDDVRRLA